MVNWLIGSSVNRQLRASFSYLCSSVPRLSLGMVSVSRSMFIRGSNAWRFVRQVSGDDAYENYVATRNDAEPRLTPGEFYHQRMERKFTGPCRCC